MKELQRIKLTRPYKDDPIVKQQIEQIQVAMLNSIREHRFEDIMGLDRRSFVLKYSIPGYYHFWIEFCELIEHNTLFRWDFQEHIALPVETSDEAKELLNTMADHVAAWVTEEIEKVPIHKAFKIVTKDTMARVDPNMRLDLIHIDYYGCR